MMANLPLRLTMKQAAQIMNVSERSIRHAQELVRSGRHDLIAACERGEISLHAALQQLKQKPPETGLDRLNRAWRNASPEDRAAFLRRLARQGGRDA